ncbi:glutamate carboxypeptidase 2-like [Pseudorca crassidens]|uniref:glutamate carboxypeptidase 2-like n=1 Tax=Pseudorca crassidens TaxID=82174 RepID=UPI00352D5E11
MERPSKEEAFAPPLARQQRGRTAEAPIPGGPAGHTVRCGIPLRETESTFVAWRRARWLCAGALVLAACLFVLGFLFGWFIKSSSEATNIPPHNVKKAFLDELKAVNIKTFLYNFTRIPHLAGTEQNFQLAKQIQSQWKEFGLASVELALYDALLSYPNKTHPNYISVIDEDGNEIFNTSLFEPPPPRYENVSDVPPFSAFSPQGMPEVWLGNFHEETCCYSEVRSHPCTQVWESREVSGTYTPNRGNSQSCRLRQDLA